MVSRESCPGAVLPVLIVVLATAGSLFAAPSGKNVRSHETAQASARIMKELMEIYKSDSYRKGLFQVEPVDDNLYEWNVKLFFLDSKSGIREDLRRVKELGGEDHLMLRVSFGGDFPVGPPLVRVIYPSMKLFNISRGGSVCMYELSPQGWVSEFTMEGILLMVIHLFEAQNRVNFMGSKQTRERVYTEERAREGYEENMNKHGWDTGRPESRPWYEEARVPFGQVTRINNKYFVRAEERTALMLTASSRA